MTITEEDIGNIFLVIQGEHSGKKGSLRAIGRMKAFGPDGELLGPLPSLLQLQFKSEQWWVKENEVCQVATSWSSEEI